MFDQKVLEMILVGIKDTLYMTLVSTFFGYVLGLPMGIILNVTRENIIKRLEKLKWRNFFSVY